MAEALQDTATPGIATQRIIGKLEGSKTDPVVIFFGGIHGNEPAGVFALREVFQRLRKEPGNIRGSIFAFSGNLPALLKGVRFIEKDLNRIWTDENISKILTSKTNELSTEEKEARILYELLSGIMEKYSGPFYFIDLHTTSSKTIPFITISDALINRKFSMQFPVPVVLGIEEHLQGALLSYANELGYVALAFESGQHQAKDAVVYNVAFSYLALVFCGCLPKASLPDFEQYLQKLKTASQGKDCIYEITGSYQVQPEEHFVMHPGFESFQPVSKHTPLAKSNGKTIKSRKNTTVFMPLYQSQGKEGFFTIRKIPGVFLRLSTWLRNSNSDTLLTVLPGVSWQSSQKKALRVNRRIARFLTKPFFHLLGYRSWKVNTKYIHMRNRERTSKTRSYKTAPWYSRKQI